MGHKVASSDEEWGKIWMAISRIHWEVQLEGLLPCMKAYVHREAFKYEPVVSSGSYLPLSILSLISLLMMLL